jgi:squalene monooxygenase
MLQPRADIDVIVGGAGVAGTAAAVALHQIGRKVLLVEPGLHGERRLCGEVFHPPGVAGLGELGLLRTLAREPAVTINGFCVWFSAAENDCIKLPYDTVPAHRTPGLSLEHCLIRQRLLEAVSELPNVTVLRRARIVGIDQSEPSSVVVQVANGSATIAYRCQLLVAADGAPSRIGRLAGIDGTNRRISTMFGYRITTEHLARHDYGHVFLAACTPVLIYAISPTEARILLDVPHLNGRRPSSADCADLFAALPAALRHEVERAAAAQPRMSALIQATDPDRSVQGRLVLVGDAGGSCHPLTASGMTMCISDALLLRNTILEQPNDLSAALRLYQRRRRWPQVTRLALAESLREAFCAGTAELRVVRRGILCHWSGSAVGRSATLALLSTADGRPLALLRQMLAVMMSGVLAHLRNPAVTESGKTLSGYRLLTGLLTAFFRQAKRLLRRGSMTLRLQHDRSQDLPRRERPSG